MSAADQPQVSDPDVLAVCYDEDRLIVADRRAECAATCDVGSVRCLCSSVFACVRTDNHFVIDNISEAIKTSGGSHGCLQICPRSRLCGCFRIGSCLPFAACVFGSVLVWNAWMGAARGGETERSGGGSTCWEVHGPAVGKLPGRIDRLLHLGRRVSGPA